MKELIVAIAFYAMVVFVWWVVLTIWRKRK